MEYFFYFLDPSLMQPLMISLMLYNKIQLCGDYCPHKYFQHVENIYGDNSHHIIESCYKALARSLRAALEMDPRNKKSIPSTKGSL